MKKYLHFAIFLLCMMFSADIAFLLPDLCENPVSAVYILKAGKVVGTMFAFIVGYLKLGIFDD